MKLLVILLVLSVCACFPSEYFSRTSRCTSCKVDTDPDNAIIYFRDREQPKNREEEKKRDVSVSVEERHIFRVKSNCNSGERVDRAGRCRQAFKK